MGVYHVCADPPLDFPPQCTQSLAHGSPGAACAICFPLYVRGFPTTPLTLHHSPPPPPPPHPPNHPHHHPTPPPPHPPPPTSPPNPLPSPLSRARRLHPAWYTNAPPTVHPPGSAPSRLTLPTHTNPPTLGPPPPSKPRLPSTHGPSTVLTHDTRPPPPGSLPLSPPPPTTTPPPPTPPPNTPPVARLTAPSAVCRNRAGGYPRDVPAHIYNGACAPV